MRENIYYMGVTRKLVDKIKGDLEADPSKFQIAPTQIFSFFYKMEQDSYFTKDS